MTATHTPPRPHLALRIGVTGHRLNRLLEPGADIDGVRAQVRVVLGSIERAAQEARERFEPVYAGHAVLYLVSPLAEGADQIVADAALHLGYKLHVPLPCLAPVYLAGFQHPTRPVAEDPTEAFNRLIGRADSVQVLDGAETAKLSGTAYAAVGRTVLRHSDILIAVWDGAEADGAGGTGEVVAQAREWEIPTVVIDPSSPSTWRIETSGGGSPGTDLAAVVHRILAPPRPGEGEDGEQVGQTGEHGVHAAAANTDGAAIAPGLIGYLHTRVAWGVGGLFNSAVAITAWEWPLRVGFMRLSRVRVERSRASWDAIWAKPTQLDSSIVQPITQLLREYYAWADGLADRFGTLHRDLSTAPYVLSLLAVFVTLWTERTASHDPRLRWQAGVAFVVAGVTVVLYRLAVHGRYHDRWIDYRSLAEELRHLAFLWPVGRPLRTPHLVGESASEASQFAWVGWYARAVARQGGLYPGILSPERLETWRSILIERFMEPQCAYHQRTSSRFHLVQERLHRGAYILFWVAFGLSMVDLGFVLLDHPPLTRSDLFAATGWIALAVAVATLFPSIAAALHAFLSQGDFWNLSRRSARMCHQLTHLIATVPPAPATIEELGNVAEDASDVMRDEVLNWRVFVRLKPPALG